MGRPVIGKKELLQWASVTSGKACQRLEDLHDGSVLLRVFAKIWPQVFRGKEDRLKAHLWDVKRNWESLRSLFVELHLPSHVFDPAGIQRSSFKPCFAILVLCFFLQQLTENRSFSCDFAYPIDQQLADFLQSRASIAALNRHGSLKENRAPRGVEEASQEGGDAQQSGGGDGVLVEVSRKAFTRQNQNSAEALASGGGADIGESMNRDKKRGSFMGPGNERAENGGPGLAPVEWRTAGMKAKGELLLANLRFENDSLRRQMEASVQERHFLMTRYEQECKEAAAAHDAELKAQAEALRGEFAIERLKLAAERGRDQQRFVLELRKVADGLRAEAQRAARGDDAQATVEETSKLRQQLLASACARAVQEDQIAALEARCAGLEAELVRQQEQVGELHRALAQEARADVDCAGLLSEEEPATAPVTSTGREAALLRQLRKLARDATQAELARQRVEEELKLKVWKLEAAAKEGARGDEPWETFGALLEEFEEEHTSERLRSEVKRLHADNTFLRERAAVFDRHNLRAHKPDAPEPAQSDPATWLPRASVLKSNEEDERVAAELLDLLKAFSHAKAFSGDNHRGPSPASSPEENARLARLEAQNRAKRGVELFWRMVVAQTVLKQRVARAAAEMRALREDARASERERAEERRAAEERLEALEGRHKEELLAIANGSRQELALLTVKKGLLEGDAADLRREMDEAMLEIRRSRAAAQQQHEEKFQLLKKRLRESRAESSHLRLKEQHYARLASCHKEAAALCEHVAITAMTVAGPAFQPGLPPDQVVAVRCAPRGTVDEIRGLIKTKADLDAQAAACMDGIRAVEGLGGGRGLSEGEADELDQVVGEATEVLKTEVTRLEKALEASRQKADGLTARAAELEVAVKQREQQLTSEGALRAHARREAERLLAANAKLQKRLVEQKEVVEQEVSRLHVQLMGAMMRLDEQSAILDASMRLGMMHDPAEPEPEPERRAEESSRAGAGSRVLGTDPANRHRNGGASDRRKGPGPEMSNRKSEVPLSGSASPETGHGRNERNATGTGPSEGNGETSGKERTSGGGSWSDSPERQGRREALGVPLGQKWGGELLEVAEEDNWDREDRKPENDDDAADRREGESISYGRFRVASLTPIPENDSRQITPEGAAEGRESATWQHEETDRRSEGETAPWQEETAEASITERNGERSMINEEWALRGGGNGLRNTEGKFDIQAFQWEAISAEKGTEVVGQVERNGTDGNGTEDTASDPIIAMIRRISQSSAVEMPGQDDGEYGTEIDDNFETSPLETEAETEQQSAKAKGRELEGCAATEEPDISGSDDFIATSVGSNRNEETTALVGSSQEPPADESRESAQNSPVKTTIPSAIAWEQYDQEWVEKKVVGTSVPGTSHAGDPPVTTGGFSAHAELADEARPAAFSMHSHVLPDYVVDWDVPESPGELGAATFSLPQSPVSPPPFALPDMA